MDILTLLLFIFTTKFIFFIPFYPSHLQLTKFFFWYFILFKHIRKSSLPFGVKKGERHTDIYLQYLRYQYMLEATQMESTQERSSRALMKSKLNTSQYCALGTNKTNDSPRLIKQNVVNRSREVVLLLYSALERPHLECCVQVRASQYKG